MMRRLLMIGGVVGVLGAGWAALSSETAPVSTGRPGRDVQLRPDTTQVRGVVPRHATLDALLRANGVAADATERLIAAARPIFDPRRLREAHPFALVTTVQGVIRSFEYEIDNNFFLRVSAAPNSDTVRAEVLPIPKTLEHAVAGGTIGGDTPTLYQAMDAAGERPELTMAMAEIFSGQIDFNNEIQPGDRFAVAFERFTREGRPTSYGYVTAAEFQNGGRTLRAIRFTPPGGMSDYFDEQGRSVRRFFLRSPLKFEPRITSGFSLSRVHPILHTERAHRGVDYAAPEGAPVVAVASGTVVSVTTDRANGRMVKLKHASGYESAYLHLSAFAPGLHAGGRVTQGEVIGRVGQTGLATGPHLHYALRKNGAFVNPVREQHSLPPGDPVPPAAMAAFRQVRDAALQQLAASSAPKGTLVARQ